MITPMHPSHRLNANPTRSPWSTAVAHGSALSVVSVTVALAVGENLNTIGRAVLIGAVAAAGLTLSTVRSSRS